MPFSNIKKRILKNIEKNMDQFFADHLFQILRKVQLQIFKKSSPVFSFSPFSNIKKCILKKLKKKPGPFFGLPPFSNIKESILTNLK